MSHSREGICEGGAQGVFVWRRMQRVPVMLQGVRGGLEYLGGNFLKARSSEST